MTEAFDYLFFIEVLTGGLLSGVMYSLVAIGFVLIYKTSGVLNFSQGAMLSTDLALRTDRPLAGLLLLSGTLLAASTWRDLAPRRAGLPVFQSHGSMDNLLPFAAAERLRALLTDSGLEVDWVQFRGGHEIPPPVLEGVHTAYLQRNLRPIVHAVTVHPAGEVFQKPLAVTGEIEILGLEPGQGEARFGPLPARPQMAFNPFGRRLYQRGLQTFTWRAEDANGDALAYDVDYRKVGDSRWRALRKGLEDPVLTWDTATVPNGRYLIRVVASDSPANPDAPPFDKEAALAALNTAVAQASGCRQEGDPNGTARVVVTFAPSGRVTSANLSGPPFAGTRTGGCIASTMRRAKIPPFSGSHVTVAKSVVIR